MEKKLNSKKSSLKKILATASAFAVIAGASTSAYGQQVTDSGNGNITIGGASDTNTLAVGAGTNVFGNNDSFFFSTAGKTLTVDATGDLAIQSIDLNNVAPAGGGLIITNGNVTLGPVGDVAGNAANTINVKVQEGRKLTLNNNAGQDAANGAIAADTFTGLGDIVLGGVANTAASTLELNTNTTLAGTINSGVANNAIVTINAGKLVQFDAIIGGANKLAAFNVGDKATADLQVAATATTFNVNNGTITTKADLSGDVKTNVNNTGTLTFDVSNGAIAYTGTIGANELALKTVAVDNAANVVTLEGKHHRAQTFLLSRDNAAQFTVADNGVLSGNVRADADGRGIIEFTANGEINGLIGETNPPANRAVLLISSNGAGTVKLNTAGTHNVNELRGANANSVFEFADGVNIDGTITNTSGGVNNVTLNLKGNSTITGAVGAGANGALSAINATGPKDSVVKFQGDTSSADLNIGKGTVELDATTGARTLTSAVNFTVADADDSEGTLLLRTAGGNNATVTGGIAQAVAGTSGRGTAVVTGNATAVFNGAIGLTGTKTKALNKLKVEGTSTARFDNAENHINQIELTGNSKLQFNVVNTNLQLGSITHGSGEGVLDVDQNTTITANDTKVAVNFGTLDARMGTLDIANGKSLTLGDGVNVHVQTLTNAANSGDLVFNKGTQSFSAANQANALNLVTLEAGATVTIGSPLLVNGATTLGDGATLELAGNYTGGDILGAAANNGTLRFVNNAAATITSTINTGGANSLNLVEFAGSADVEFKSQVQHAAGKTFKFTDAATQAITVTFSGATDVSNNVFTNDSTTTHNVALGQTANFDQNLSTDVTKQLNFVLSNGVDAVLIGGDHTGTNFVTATATKGELELNNTDHVINSAGTSSKELAKVTFTKNATITNGTFASQVVVADGKTASLGGTISSGNFTLGTAAAASVSFLDDARVDSVVKTNADATGTATFAGSATVNQNLGEVAQRLGQVTFADDVKYTAQLGADIYSANTAFRKGNVELTGDRTIHGVVTSKNGNIKLGTNTLTVGDSKVGSSLTFVDNDTVYVTVKNNGDSSLSGGKIVVTKNAALAYTADKKVTISIDDTKLARPTGGETKEFIFVNNSDNADLAAANLLAAGNLNFNKKNDFIDWTVTSNAKGNIIGVAKDRSNDIINEILGARADSTDKANIAALANAGANTDGAKVIDLIQALKGDANKVEEVLDRLTSVTTVTDAIETNSSTVASGLGSRTQSLAGNQGTPVQTRQVSSAGESGVSAGDDHARFGAWLSPFFSQTTQKSYKGAAGYKDNTFGASFGFDTRANDDLIIGAAVTASGSELKHKNFKSGDKTKVNSLMLSLYGLQQITDSWFVNGSASFGSNEVKSTERRVSETSYELAESKYNSMSFAADAMFGYSYVTDQATFTPMAGFRYTRVNDGSYKETGTSFQNLNVSRKASNKFEVMVGGRVTGGTFNVDNFVVTPEAHAFVSQDLVGKNPKALIELNGTKLTAKSNSTIKTRYNVGFGANAHYGMMEYGASYDAHLATKSVGHQGTLRLRVNF